MQKFSISMTRRTRESAIVEIEAETLEEAKAIAMARYDDAELDDEFTHDESQVTIIDDAAPTNASRAARVENVLQQYKAEQLGESGPTSEDDVVDLLTDVRHYCDANDLPFYELDQTAHNHYLHELAEAGR